MSISARRISTSLFAAVLLVFTISPSLPARAVDCYPPGSCNSDSTQTYQAVGTTDLSTGTAAAQQCTGTSCVPIEVTKSVSSTGITLSTSAGVVVQIRPVSGGGTPLQVSSDGTLVIPASGGVTITLSGLTPGTYVDVYFNSERIFLGKVKVGADGKVNATLPLPASVDVGTHTAQVIATDYAGRVVSVAIGVVVKGAVPTGASRFVISNATPTVNGKVVRGTRVALRAGLFGVAAGAKASVATTSKLGACTTKVAVKTSAGKPLLAATCMTYSKKDGKAEYTWAVPSTYKGRATAVFTFKETGRAAATYSRTFVIG